MRDLHQLDRYRMTDAAALSRTGGWAGDEARGAFVIPSPIDKAPMLVLAAADLGWDHVSVSRRNRCPSWPEMEHVAQLFFQDDEIAVQFHVPRDQHINIHPYVLHWWRCHDQAPVMPPRIFV